ncbi:extracellular solute-binding protein [Paenibacillus eucommiae]|uniref:Aldouronate transport system substrate-binding protein n=1 Tax=Paenibacillus eucommiae TaxID=1355755 RepID=A0ABS4IV57_9BACL|nr:extracellular solute-binding protein [Paenibacillus eucommiae]MBP1991464.1 putative aldouronate transport system substrate-binding protein [Paenibacillus eucommiae]
MKSRRRVLAVGSVLLLAIILVIAGCGSKKDPQTPVETSAGEKPQASTNAAEPKVPLTMFMSDSGVALPANVNASDNKFINIVKDYANVDLKLELVPAGDLATKFNLMLASGNVTDLVHEHWLQPAANEAGRAGAFLDLKPFYDKSPQVQKYITPEMLELAKDPVSGKNFRMPMAWTGSPQGSGVIARYDLVEKYNEGRWPESTHQWVELMRKIKKAEPDSMILTNWVIGDNLFAYGGTVIFRWYGVNPYTWRIMDGKIIPDVLTPEYKAAVGLMRQLYEEGLLDKEFATNDNPTYYSNWYNKNILLTVDATQQFPAVVGGFLKEKPEAKLAFAPFLKENPKELADPKYAQGGYATSPIMGHGLYISAKTKDPERAWKALEGFYTDELREAIFWGEEGVTYTVKDGIKVPDGAKMAEPEHSYGLAYAVGIGFVAGADADKSKNEQILGADYAKAVYDSMVPIDEAAKKNGELGLPGFAPPDEAALKTSESNQAINKITVKAIMGEISMDQFDGEIKGWEAKYRGLIYDPMQKYLDENKDMMRDLGFKTVDW